MRQKFLVLIALALAIAQGLAAQSTLPRGDVDGSGQVTIADVTQVISVMLGGSDNMVADVNGDGQVTIADVTELISLILNGPKYVHVSSTLLNFGDIYVGQSKLLTFTVTGTNIDGMISLFMQNTSSNVVFNIYPAALPANGGTVFVTCTATGAGVINGTLLVNANGVLEIVSLLGNVVNDQPSVLVSPASLNFGNVLVGQSKEMTLTVEGTNTVGNISLTLPNTSTNADFTISPETLPSSGGTVTVTCFATSVGEINENLIVSSNGVEDKTVTLSGTAVFGPPSFLVSPTSLNFGAVRRGEIRSMTFMVKGRNLNGNLSISCDNPDFVVDRTFITPEFAANGVTVIVIYNANTIGDISGTITIAGGGASSKTVSLTAMCERSGDDSW